jgi:hypothetical protein
MRWCSVSLFTVGAEYTRGFFLCSTDTANKARVGTDVGAVPRKVILGGHTVYRYKLRTFSGPGSSVGIATDYDRIPVGRDFPPVQTGPRAHPVSCKMSTGSFPGSVGACC